MNKSALVLLIMVALSAAANAQVPGNVEHPFYVSADETYSDYIQFADGHAQGTCVFYFTEEVGDFNRLVVFCSGKDDKGQAYEDAKNNRIVWSRPLSEYTAFVRFQQELGKSTVYGVWITRADGEITTIALQTYRKGATKYNAAEPAPAIGNEYTGK